MLSPPNDKVARVQSKMFHSRSHKCYGIVFLVAAKAATSGERVIYNALVKKFKELFNYFREIFIDEAMVPFKGKLTIKVRMPDKPVKFGA